MGRNLAGWIELHLLKSCQSVVLINFAPSSSLTYIVPYQKKRQMGAKQVGNGLWEIVVLFTSIFEVHEKRELVFQILALAYIIQFSFS